MPLVTLHHLLNVSVQLANERGFTKIPVFTCGSHIRLTVTFLSTCQRSTHRVATSSKFGMSMLFIIKLFMLLTYTDNINLFFTISVIFKTSFTVVF
jgi:hypothetical protein